MRSCLRPSSFLYRSFSTVSIQASKWSHLKLGPPDAILGITEAYKADKKPQKINLGVGAYRDDAGKPFILNTVKKAEKIIAEKKLDKEYSPISGTASFCKLAAQLAYGRQSSALEENRVAVAQSISGTGALRICGEFLKRFYRGEKTIYLPKPTWGNHKSIFEDAGLEVASYQYYNPQTRDLDFEGLVHDLKTIPRKSIVLLHACAHNPTGVDISREQWMILSQVIKSHNHLPLFDMAYQGFASGDFSRDAFAVRYFVDQGHSLFLCQSFAKNMGLYGERVGTVSLVAHSLKEAEAALSQFKIIIRPMYSNPPIHGSLIATEILSSPELRQEWFSEVKHMADRISSMRKLLVDNLIDQGSRLNWDHITKQIGMFCYTGLDSSQVDRLRQEYSIYLTRDGRISMAGVSTKNCDYLANAIHQVTSSSIQ
eukprot:Sdes_comp19299_c0_seq1m10376